MAGAESGRRTDDPPPGQDLHLDVAKLVGQAMEESTAQPAKNAPSYDSYLTIKNHLMQWKNSLTNKIIMSNRCQVKLCVSSMI